MEIPVVLMTYLVALTALFDGCNNGVSSRTTDIATQTDIALVEEEPRLAGLQVATFTLEVKGYGTIERVTDGTGNIVSEVSTFTLPHPSNGS